MDHSYLPAPSPQEDSHFSLKCWYCDDTRKYRLGDLLEHSGWCTGRREAAVAAARAQAAAAAQAHARAAERAARAAEAAQAARAVRRIAAKQERSRIPEAVLEMKKEREAAEMKKDSASSANSPSSSQSTSSSPSYVDTH